MNPPTFHARDGFEALREPRPTPGTWTGLWGCGSLEGLRRPTVAIVGTRAATAYGRRLAHEFARDLGRAGCCILSGLALGIDAAAHEGALSAGAPTIGVLGGGHDCFFPPRNAGLAERICAAAGAVVSPYAPGVPAQPHQFLQRNGVVAGLADALVVIEAPARSGALNTASWAAGSIPVLAVPGDVDRPHVAGCLALLRDGATLARNAADVLEALGLGAPGVVSIPLPAIDDPLQQALLARLAQGECDLGALIEAGGAGVGAVTAALSILEIHGVIEATDGGRYANLMR
ncbi:MAG TPA: DNA-processing protein DprA [Candidatus Baltobacteraceae bacterium]